MAEDFAGRVDTVSDSLVSVLHSVDQVKAALGGDDDYSEVGGQQRATWLTPVKAPAAAPVAAGIGIGTLIILGLAVWYFSARE